MSVSDANDAVQEIRRLAENGDGPQAHVADDALRERVLNAIAREETDDPRALAEAALQTTLLDFDRWYE